MQTTENNAAAIADITKKLLEINDRATIDAFGRIFYGAEDFQGSAITPIQYGTDYRHVNVQAADNASRLKAIHKLANQPDDLVVIKDRYYTNFFNSYPQDIETSAPSVVAMSEQLQTEMRMSSEALYKKQHAGYVPVSTDSKFVPKRIFVFDSIHFYSSVADMRSLQRWAYCRFSVVPLIVGL